MVIGTEGWIDIESTWYNPVPFTVHAVDGTAWYKQYAVDAVDKSPYMAPDGSIAFNESIVKKLPPAPRRKDKI